IEALIPAEVAAYQGRAYKPEGGEGEAEDDDQTTLRPGDAVFVPSYGSMCGNGRVVSVKGDQVVVKFETAGMFMSGGRRSSGRGVKMNQNQVQRVRESLPMGIQGWQVEGFEALVADMARLVGEETEVERAEAAA
ncbi:hypothetical protein TSOC_002274, partial [Tetrabaena socialis]